MDAQPPVDYEIGVAIVEAQGHPEPVDLTATDSGSDRWEPAGRRVRARPADHPTDQLMGKEYVDALAAGIGRQITAMANQIQERIELEESSSRDPHRLAIDTITVSFGIGAKAALGRALSVFANVGGESSIDITLTLKRPGGPSK